MAKKYTDEFKLQVVSEYYKSPVGVRTIALRYNLPSKNYITNWESQLIKKGLLPEGSTKINKANARSKESITRKDHRSSREALLEAENERLKARIAYFEGLEEFKPFIKKK